jgi:hypothetical protein
LKKNNLIKSFIWPFVSSGRAPLDDFLALENSLINKGLAISFGALTWFPPVAGGGGGLTILFLPIGGTSLVAGHPCGHEMLHSHVLGGYDERGGELGFLGRRMNWATTSCNTNDLDLTVEVVAAARQGKTKGSSSKKHK